MIPGHKDNLLCSVQGAFCGFRDEIGMYCVPWYVLCINWNWKRLHVKIDRVAGNAGLESCF